MAAKTGQSGTHKATNRSSRMNYTAAKGSDTWALSWRWAAPRPPRPKIRSCFVRCPYPCPSPCQLATCACKVYSAPDHSWSEIRTAPRSLTRALIWRWMAGRNWPRSSCGRSEEHTSELQSRGHLVCRLLLEKKKKNLLHNGLERLARSWRYEGVLEARDNQYSTINAQARCENSCRAKSTKIMIKPWTP